MLYMLLGAVSNGIRGGQLWRWLQFLFGLLPKKFKKKHKKKLQSIVAFVEKHTPHDPINAVTFALCVYFISMDKVAGALAFICMMLGASPGWGAYIGAIMHQPKESEQTWIDRLIENLDGVKWGVMGLTLRGLFWGLFISIPLFYSGLYLAGAWAIFAGSMMGLIYLATIRFTERVLRTGTGWAESELVFGAWLWSCLSIAAATTL